MVNRKIITFCLLFAASVFSLRALGKTDEDEKKPLNDEWILCITEFDFSLLGPARRIAGDVITRNLVDTLRSVSYRLRVSPEYAYYEGYAWQQSVNAAAKAISSKQDERTAMLYRGDPDWRYRRNLKKVDGEIEKLMEDYAIKEAEKPLINNEPRFGLSQSNINGTYPAPPAPGGERRFCQNQKADAFLAGSIREFHGRYYVRLQLFTLYTNSYVYDDDVIFSLEDAAGAVIEISARLTAVISGNKAAAIAVKADPPESQILINQNYAGRGNVEPREHPPGVITVAVAAEGYEPALVETELSAGELAEIEVSLSPLSYSDVNIEVPGAVDAAVYHGALYVGQAPLTLRLPLGQLGYVAAEAGDEEAKAVFTSPDMPGEAEVISLRTKIPLPSGERRVNKARGRYYWAWGGTWVTGIAAWITYGIYTSQNEALRESTSEEFLAKAKTMNIISMGAIALVSTAVVYEVYQIWRYLRTATENVTPIVRQGKVKK
ncbi:MAG: PEGA domain-containing protein [Treponema sp.]|nr:PEGA domain-containing protein [Treponema sp.]